MKTTKLYFYFSLSAILCLLVLAIAPIKSTFREWKKYQKQYYQSEANSIEFPEVKKRILNTPLEIKQIVLKELNRVDRCMTCHISIEDPRYSENEHPLKSHPGDILLQHSVEKFGCTVCHEGQGQATSVHAAHGETEWWNRPLLPGDYVFGTCGQCHTDAQIPNLLFGKGNQLFKDLGCIGCHTIGGEGGNIGPELVGVGSRRNAQWLYDHFEDPEKISPGSVMPKYTFSDDEIRSLVLLMYGFSDWDIPYEYRAQKEVAQLKEQLRPVDKIKAGKGIFEKFGCAGCHGRSGSGEIRNPNAPGNLVPAIIYVKEAYTKDEMKEYLLKGAVSQKDDPNLPNPPIFMPSWLGKLSDLELDNLIEYLFSLYPGDEVIW